MGSLVCAGERVTLPVMRLGLQILDPFSALAVRHQLEAGYAGE
jgi:hypothetical protein